VLQLTIFTVLHINNDVWLAVDFNFDSLCLIACQKGVNPVVINSGGQRRILSSGEKATIKSCDVIELIPGSYYFKYLTLSDQSKFSMTVDKSGGDSEHKNAGLGTKRARESNGGPSPGHLMVFS